MLPPAGRLRLTLRRAALVVALLVTAAAAAFFPRAGTYLVQADPLSKADVLFVLSGTRVERWLEAVDLYKAGYAPAILLSPGITEAAESALRARGVRFPSDADLARDAIVQLGVPVSAVMILDRPVDNTAQEAAALRQVAAARGWRSAIVVTSKYHSRRSAFAFHRAFRDSGVRVAVWPSHYDDTDPAHWWRRRADARYVLLEYQKLLAYRLGLSE